MSDNNTMKRICVLMLLGVLACSSAMAKLTCDWEVLDGKDHKTKLKNLKKDVKIIKKKCRRLFDQDKKKCKKEEYKPLRKKYKACKKDWRKNKKKLKSKDFEKAFDKPACEIMKKSYKVFIVTNGSSLPRVPKSVEFSFCGTKSSSTNNKKKCNMSNEDAYKKAWSMEQKLQDLKDRAAGREEVKWATPKYPYKGDFGRRAFTQRFIDKFNSENKKNCKDFSYF